MATVLDEAEKVTSGDRQRAYGHPLDNHTCTAGFWSGYLRRKHGIQVELTPEDVCVLNVLQKISREANMPKDDNLVDICGFTRNIEMIREERLRRDDGRGVRLVGSKEVRQVPEDLRGQADTKVDRRGSSRGVGLVSHLNGPAGDDKPW